MQAWKIFVEKIELEYQQASVAYQATLTTTSTTSTSTTSTTATTTTTSTTTTTTTTTPYEIQEYLTFESDGKPALSLPEKPVKREQFENEKAVS